MTLIAMISTLDLLAYQHPALAVIVELGLKSVAIVLFGFLVVSLLHNASASSKNLVWRMVFSVLFALPFLQGFVPEMQIAVHAYHPPSADLARDASSDSIYWPLLQFTLLIGYWLISGLLFLRVVAGLYRTFEVGKNATAIDDLRIHAILKKATAKNGSHHSIELLISHSVTSPVTLGVISHKIIFPPAANGWDDRLIEQVIGHELGHIQRNDWVQQLVSRLVICLFWFNPLVIIAANRMSLEAEKACDDFAIDDTGCRISYAENLLWLAQQFKVPSRDSISLKIVGAQHVLLQRVAYILSENKHQHRIDRDSCLPGVLMAVLMAMPISAVSLTLEEQSFTSISSSRIFSVEYFSNNSAESELFQRELKSHSFGL